MVAMGMWRRDNGREVPNERHWSAHTSTSARNARADLVPYTPLPAETGPVWAPDRLSVWPVEGGRSDRCSLPRRHGRRASPRPAITAGEAGARCVGQARPRRWSDPHRASRARSYLACARGVPRPPSLTAAGLQAVGSWDHRRGPLVDGVHDLGVVDPSQIHRGDREVGVLDMRVIWRLCRDPVVLASVGVSAWLGMRWARSGGRPEGGRSGAATAGASLSVGGELTLQHMHGAWRRYENVHPAVGE